MFSLLLDFVLIIGVSDVCCEFRCEGKWYLGRLRNENYSYENAVAEVEQCGFGTVSALYWANHEQVEGFMEGDYSHNLEWMVSEAISFINESVSCLERY